MPRSGPAVNPPERPRDARAHQARLSSTNGHAEAGMIGISPKRDRWSIRRSEWQEIWLSCAGTRTPMRSIN
ncbi:hypothetical protein X946_5322 [Burkholderia sp. ABCPW 111]|nr:hypothetical protein X946_5322 [Burkholderia sp. ABCPW 111]